MWRLWNVDGIEMRIKVSNEFVCILVATAASGPIWARFNAKQPFINIVSMWAVLDYTNYVQWSWLLLSFYLGQGRMLTIPPPKCILANAQHSLFSVVSGEFRQILAQRIWRKICETHLYFWEKWHGGFE